MNGEDKHDQYRAKYGVGRDSKKLRHYIFWFIVNSAIVNAYIVYKMTSSHQTSKKRFRHQDQTTDSRLHQAQEKF